MFKVHVEGGQIYEGSKVFAIDPNTKSIIISNEDGSYHLINHSQIINIEGDF